MARTSSKKRIGLYGQGTYFVRTKSHTRIDGKVAKYEQHVVGVHAFGVSKRFSGTTKAGAYAARDAWLVSLGGSPEAKPSAGVVANAAIARVSITIGDAARRFLAHKAADKRIAANTVRDYSKTFRLHIEPHVAKERLEGFDARAFYDKLRALGVSDSMVRRVHVALRTISNFAVEHKLIAVSPVASLRVKTPKTAQFDVLTDAQVRKLLKAAKGDRLGAMIELAITHGLRQGECFGLRWRDVDLDGRRLVVSGSVFEVAGDVGVKAPKSGKKRAVALRASVVDALRRRLDLAESEGFAAESDLVFPSVTGTWLRKSNFLRTTWSPIREAAGLSDLRFHDLRHQAASILVAAGVPVLVVQEQLGHFSPEFTLKRYGHLAIDAQAREMNRLDNGG